MTRLILFQLLFTIALNINAQEYEREFADLESFLLKRTIDENLEPYPLDKLDLEETDSIKRPIVERLRGFMHFDRLVDEYEFFRTSFNLMDLNNNGRLDIFYSGYLGGASDSYSYIFLNTGNGLEQVFSGEMGLFISAVNRDGIFVGLIYCYEGQAADCPQMSYLNLLMFSGTDEETENVINYPNDTKVPLDLFSTPIDFTIKNEKYFLRSTPVIDNSTGSCELTGNIRYEYKKGHKGKSFASETDETGRVWWYVIMDNNIAGWMSSKYLEKK